MKVKDNEIYMSTFFLVRYTFIHTTWVVVTEKSRSNIIGLKAHVYYDKGFEGQRVKPTKFEIHMMKSTQITSEVIFVSFNCQLLPYVQHIFSSRSSTLFTQSYSIESLTYILDQTYYHVQIHLREISTCHFKP